MKLKSRYATGGKPLRSPLPGGAPGRRGQRPVSDPLPGGAPSNISDRKPAVTFLSAARAKASPPPITTRFALASLLALAATSTLVAEVPSASYIFPAGGQQGATVDFKVGGHYLHGEASFRMSGPGVEAEPSVREVDTLWFEGPLIPMPASQQKEDYPRDHSGRVKIAADAPAGVHYWHVSTSQGITPAGRFIVGRLPEVVEEEIDGAPIPTAVSLPVTINGRIFPREDVDVWTFSAKAGENISCSVDAQRLGSPLNARLEILDPRGARIAEVVAAPGKDPSLQWEAPADGTYSVRIHDIDFGGLQHYVYRLTVTNGTNIVSTYPLGGRRGAAVRLELLGNGGAPRGDVGFEIPADAPDSFPLPTGVAPGLAETIFLDVGDAPECLEAEPNDSLQRASASAASVPCVLNGRIQAAGDVDYWSVSAGVGEPIECELVAGELGSPLFPVMTVYDPDGKEVARAGAPGDPQTGAILRIDAAVAGTYHVAIAERFPHRGGAQFGYRLHLRRPRGPDFKLTLASDVVTVFREVDGLDEAEKKLRPPAPPAKLVVEAERLGGFAGEIGLVAAGLPEGVHLAGDKIAKDKNQVELTFNAGPGVRVQVAHATISGVATIGENQVERRAAAVVARGEPPLAEVLLAVAMPAPFYFTGDYNSYVVPRGSVYRRGYQLHRGGFSGPVCARLADRQTRHLQGNRGPTITIPPGATNFEYGAVMAPRLEIGRTSRTMIMVYATVVDSDGSEHIVSYASDQQNDQLIGQIVTGLLSVQALEPSLAVEPGTSVEVPVVIGRHQSLQGVEVQVELCVPAHFQGVRSDPATVPAGQDSTTITVYFDHVLGDFNMPAKMIATTVGSADPHVAESPIEFFKIPKIGEDAAANNVLPTTRP